MPKGPATIESLFRWFNRREHRLTVPGKRTKYGIYCERTCNGLAEVQFGETDFNVYIYGSSLRAALLNAREAAKIFDATGLWPDDSDDPIGTEAAEVTEDE